MSHIRNIFAAIALYLLAHTAAAINHLTRTNLVPSATVPARPGAKAHPTSKSADTYKAVFNVGNLNDGSTGRFVVQVHPEWAPLGAHRFKELLDDKFFDNNKFFRVIAGFMAQFGISGDPAITRQWSLKSMSDDPNMNVTNARGRITFATAGKDTRNTQVFINLVDNTYLDKQGFTPFGEVTAGMDVIDKLFFGYDEGAPLGKGPNQMTIEQQGNTYLDASYPHLSTIVNAHVFLPSSAWGHTRRAAFVLLGMICLLAIAAVTLYRSGALDNLHAKLKVLKSRISSATAAPAP